MLLRTTFLNNLPMNAQVRLKQAQIVLWLRKGLFFGGSSGRFILVVLLGGSSWVFLGGVCAQGVLGDRQTTSALFGPKINLSIKYLKYHLIEINSAYLPPFPFGRKQNHILTSGSEMESRTRFQPTRKTLNGLSRQPQMLRESMESMWLRTLHCGLQQKWDKAIRKYNPLPISLLWWCLRLPRTSLILDPQHTRLT